MQGKYQEQGKKQYDNTNTLVFYTNDRKRDGKKDPDYTGTLNVDGVEYFLNIWEKTGSRGSFWSGLIKQKGAPNPNKQAYAPRQAQATQQNNQRTNNWP